MFRAQRPREVMAINKYYRQEWAPPGTDPNILEKMAGNFVEPLGKEAVELLLNRPHALSEPTITQLALYLAFQRTRVPRQAKSARALAESYTLTQMGRQVAADFLHGEIELSESVRFTYMQSVLKPMTDYLLRMQWNVIHPCRGMTFVTSDSPVTFYNTEFPPPTEAGIALAGTKILFPIRPDRILEIIHPEFGRDTNNPLEVIPKPEAVGFNVSICINPNAALEETVRRINKVIYWQSDRLIVGDNENVLHECISSSE